MAVPINPWRRFPADPDDWFSAEEIAKAKSYVRPLTRLTLVERAIGLAALVRSIWTHAVPELLDALDVSNWVGRLVVALVVVQVMEVAVSTPFAAYRELGYDKRWGFSTQTVRGFVSDLAKQLLVGLVIGVVLLLPLWALIRTTDLWWILGWLVMGLFVVGLGLLAPVLIMPLFNKFTPLDDAELREDLLQLARQVDADISEIQVSDASRRTRKDNAFVTGLGKSRRLVLFDTLLPRPREQVRSVAAHEIGHWKLRHVVRIIPIVIAAVRQLRRAALVLGWDAALGARASTPSRTRPPSRSSCSSSRWPAP